MEVVIRYIAAVVILSVYSTLGHAQTSTSYELHEKGAERINAATNVAPLSVDTVFGDQISHFNGSVEFNNVDISVPGNNGLPVELRRSLKVDDRFRINGLHLGGFAEWDLDIPHLSGIFAASPGSWKPAGGRCSVPGDPGFSGTMAPEDYWNGYQLHIPGAGDQSLLMDPSPAIPSPGNGTTYPWITKGMWRISCKTTTKNGYGGEAFIATSPEGVRYHLDWGIAKNHASVKRHVGGLSMSRQVIYFLVSRVEDRFGNWVDYTYSGDKLTGIASSDSRQISLTYSSNKIVGASSSIGNWSYAYTGNSLVQVTQPDASKWSYVTTGGLSMMPPAWTPAIEDPTGCPDFLEPYEGEYGLTVTAPSGAMGKFSFAVLQHKRSSVPDTCVVVSPSYWYLKVPRFNWALTLTSKTVMGAGLPGMSWNYAYGQPNPLLGGDTKQNSISGPGGSYERYQYGTGVDINEGQLLKVEKGSGPSAILSVQTNTYMTAAEVSGQNFPYRAGLNPLLYADQLSSSWLRPLKQSVIVQQGVSFNWQVDNCAGKFCFDVFARQTSVTKSNTTPGSQNRNELTNYEDKLPLWVIGQQKKLTINNIVASEITYNSLARPTVFKSFGKIRQSLSYNADGTVGTVKDGNNNAITLGSWKRGVPQAITYPATPDQPTPASTSAIVNDAGWITRVTNEAGCATNYGYDAMGRLSSIAYPVADSTAWAATIQSFAPSLLAQYGLPAGHWQQTVQTGNGSRVIHYDALWRPVVEEAFDNSSTAIANATRSLTVKRYDANSRLAFQSYPMRTLGNYATVTAGTTTTYDALDRVFQVSVPSADSITGTFKTTMEYLAGFQTRVTNPRGKQTTTSYMTWDQPTYDYPITIAAPEGTYTHIARDVFGKPFKLRRSNSISSTGGTVALDRHYYYDAYQQLCRTMEPETGSTVMQYDDAGNLLWSAAGLDLPSTTACYQAQGLASGRRVDRAYDARNRVMALVFPDHLGDTSYTYTPDSLLASVTADNGGANQVTTQYSYNRRRLMTQERELWGSTIDWPITYVYNANGHVSAQQWHGLNITYAPNALGQPTQAGTYATGVSYHPNGGVAQFTYGNGIVHTMTQNDRQLSLRSADVYGATKVIDDSYDYDENGNVAGISDALGSHRGDRTMTYDGLDRLTATTSPMYGTGASYSYDVLDNLTRTKVGGTAARDHYYCYDGTWQLTNIKTGSCTGTTVSGLGYDVQGNLANKNGVTYSFDYGNRLRTVSTSPTSSYIYDGHGRRVRDITGASKYSQYSNSGQLLQASDARQQVFSEYIYLQGSLVAVRERDTSVTPNVYSVKYQHTDALGSPVAVTNESRVLLERREYEPYGRQLMPVAKDGPGYTGHEYDAATGMNYMQQRYYDPAIGRFLSVDPVTAYNNPVRQFNRYRYANGNPYKFIDPDGRRSSMRDHPGITQSYVSGSTTAAVSSAPTGSGRVSSTRILGQNVSIMTSKTWSEGRSSESIQKIESMAKILNGSMMTERQMDAVKAINKIIISDAFNKTATTLNGTLYMLESELHQGSDIWNASVMVHDGLHNIRSSLGALSYGPKEERYIIDIQMDFLRRVGASQSEINYAKDYDTHSDEAIGRQSLPIF